MGFFVLDILNAGGFLSSVILFVNNVFELNYYTRIFLDPIDNFYILNKIMIVLASFIVLYMTITSPYDTESFNLTSDVRYLVIFCICLLYLSLSTAVKDPELILSASYETLTQQLEPFLSFAVDESDFVNFNTVSAFTYYFLLGFNIARLYCFGYAIMNMFILISNTDIRKRSYYKHLQVTLIERSFYIILIGVNFILSIVSFVGEKSWEQYVKETTYGSLKKQTLDTFDNVMELLDDKDWIKFFQSTDFSFLYTFFGEMLMLVMALAIVVLFHTEFQYCLIVCSFVSINLMSRLDSIGDDSWKFSVVVILFLLEFIPSCLLVLKIIWTGLRSNPVDTVMNPIPNILFKAGNMLSVISLIFLFFAYTYPWVQLRFTPSGITLSVEEGISAASDKIDGLVADVLGVTKVLDPCVRKKVSREETTFNLDNNSDITGFDSNEFQFLDTIANNVERVLSADSTSKYRACVNSYPIVNGYKTIDYNTASKNTATCVSFKTDIEKQVSDMKSKYFDDQDGEISRSYTDEDAEDEDSVFVDERCRNVQCTVLLSAGVAAVALAAFPFGGTAGMAAKITSKAVHTVYKIGRKFARVLPKIKRRKKTIKRMAKVIQTLAISTTKKVVLTNDMLWIFLPLIIGGFVSIVLIVIRRRVFIDKTASESVQRTQRIAQGLKFLFGIWTPIVLSEFIFLVVLTFFKSYLVTFLTFLPETFLRGEAEFGMGYESLRLAYSIGLSGHACVLVSNLMYLTVNSVFLVVYTILKPFYDVLRGIWELVRNLFFPKRVRNKKTGKRAVSDTLLQVFGNWNSQWLFPLLFSIPVVILYSISFDPSYKYIKFGYTANSRLLSASSDLGDTILIADQTESIGVDTDDEQCGLVGEIVTAVLNSLKTLAKVSYELSNFSLLIQGALNLSTDFLSKLRPLLDSTIIALDFLLFDNAIVENLIIFAIPIINTMLIFVSWVTIFLVGKLSEASLLYRLFAKNYVYDPENRNDGERADEVLNYTIPIFIFYMSLVNIVINQMVMGLAQIASNVDMPFISLSVATGTKFYFTILASLLNILSVVALYVNLVFPDENTMKQKQLSVMDRLDYERRAHFA